MSSGRGSLTFQNFVRVANEWHPATLPQNPLVTGPSFPLTASRVSSTEAALSYEGSGGAQSLDGKSLRYNWSAEISAFGDVAFPWFRFRSRSTCLARSACNKELRLSLRSSSGCLPTRRSWKASLEVGGVFCCSSPRGIHWARGETIYPPSICSIRTLVSKL